MLIKDNIWFIEYFCDPIIFMPDESTIFFSVNNDTTSRDHSFCKSNLIHENILKLLPKLCTLLKDDTITLAENYTSYRRYTNGHFIDWHIDYEHELLKETIEYECILTLKNTTNSITETTTRKFITIPGSLMIVCHKGQKHRVTKVTNNGERIILRFKLNSQKPYLSEYF